MKQTAHPPVILKGSNWNWQGHSLKSDNKLIKKGIN